MKYLTPVFYFPDVLNILVRCVLPQLSVFAFFYCPLPVLFPFMAQHRSWYDFLMDALIEGGVMKRLDLAINDMTGILDIPELTEKCNHEECISVFRSFKSYRSGELVRSQEQDKYGMGNTLYIGSLKSEIYFCIYEKDYEQYVKYDIPIEDTKIKNRFEIRLKNERAYYAVRDLLTYHDAERTAFDIINRYMRFADKEVEKRRS